MGEVFLAGLAVGLIALLSSAGTAWLLTLAFDRWGGRPVL